MPLPEALVPKTPGSPALVPVTPAAVRPETYEVKKGDAIIKIARKFDMTAAQLKQFNDLKDDRIQIGRRAAHSHAGAVAHDGATAAAAPTAGSGTEQGSRRKEETRQAGGGAGARVRCRRRGDSANSTTCCCRCFSIGKCFLRA